MRALLSRGSRGNEYCPLITKDGHRKLAFEACAVLLDVAEQRAVMGETAAHAARLRVSPHVLVDVFFGQPLLVVASSA
jgi:hypothetical protein